MDALSKKQISVLKSKLRRINILEGSIRSGKTYVSVILFALIVAAAPKDHEFIMVGKTLTTLNRNCLSLLKKLEPTFEYSTGQKKGVLYGHIIWLEGANDERAEDKIRGMTLAGAYIDELTLIPKSFYQMLLGRLSVKGAKLIATTNPGSPAHYVYTDILENEEIDKQTFKFNLEDNPALDPQFVEEIKKEYSGVFYQRYILGEWVIAEGLVYPMYDNTAEAPSEKYEKMIISIDYGIQNPFAMLLWGKKENVWYLVKEYYHSGRDTNHQMTDEQYYEQLEILAAGLNVERVIIDPSASSFITLIKQKGKFKVRPADNAVVPGIQHTASALANKKIMVDASCTNTIKEFGIYSWNPDGEDVVIKENDHCMDAVRYFVQTERLFIDKEPYRGWLS